MLIIYNLFVYLINIKSYSEKNQDNLNYPFRTGITDFDSVDLVFIVFNS